MKNHNQAILDFNSAINLDSSYPEVYYYRGLSKIELKSFNEAISDFNKSLSLNL